MPRPTSCSHSLMRAVSHARRPMASSSARRCALPTSGCRLEPCSPSTPPWPSGCRSPGSTHASTMRPTYAMFPRPSPASTASLRVSPNEPPDHPVTDRRTRERSQMLADAYLRSGKVRDLYARPDGSLMLVASDRISAFDVVLPTEIPDKGRVLTGLSRHWFATTADIVQNHLISTEIDDPDLRGRTMICRPTTVIPVEAVVRGYLAGSGWKEYRVNGRVCGVELPAGLVESDRLPEPIFTPATKAEAGEHDENIDFEAMAAAVGRDVAERVRELAIALYRQAAAATERVGIVLADTKFEFGIDEASGDIILIDEALTPDSSRFWDASTYEPGRAQGSFDKQFVRDWLETQAWDKTAPGPALPEDVVTGTRARYVEAYERITGASFSRYLEEDVIAP